MAWAEAGPNPACSCEYCGPVKSIGSLPDGRPVNAIDLAAHGFEARILDYGARLAVFRRAGGENLCIRPETLAAYLERKSRYAGPVIAPVLNRISDARAEVDGREYRFEANENGRHTLHSGPSGTHDMLWEVSTQEVASVALTVTLPDGRGGFPGDRRISVRYRLDDAGLDIVIEAVTDAPTLMNPGLHGLFTIGGQRPASEHRLTIPATRYLPVTSDTLPTGEVADVAGTPFDHREPRPPDAALDHNFCFETGFGLRARLEGPGPEVLEVHSDSPGLQAFAGGPAGVALEPQLWPDAPHHSSFPSIRLDPGQTFRQHTRLLVSS